MIQLLKETHPFLENMSLDFFKHPDGPSLVQAWVAIVEVEAVEGGSVHGEDLAFDGQTLLEVELPFSG